MFRINRLHLEAFCAWELIAAATLVVLILAMRPNHMWNKNDLMFFAYVTVCGIFVTAAIAFFSRPFGKVGAVVTGLLWGIAPSFLMASWVFMARPGFEESAGTAAVAMVLAAPSALGGAIAGSICSRQKGN
jgi:hypothetical protein